MLSIDLLNHEALTLICNEHQSIEKLSNMKQVLVCIAKLRLSLLHYFGLLQMLNTLTVKDQ